MNNVQRIIKEICNEKEIDFKLVSKDWIITLQKGDKVRYIVGYKFPLNNQAVGRICDDKYALYEVMKQFNIPIVEHYIVFKDYDKNEIVNYCKKYNFNMVIKNNVGTCGNDMYHTKEESDLLDKLDDLLSKNYSVSLSPYYDIKTEYRAIILNNEIELVYGKKRPIVIGNGESTIYELLCDFNKEYFSNIDNKADLKEVLKVNEKYEYNWQFNLSKGAIPFLIEDETKEMQIKEMAKKISSRLGTSFASIDLIELEDGSLLLLEVNSGVMLDNFNKCLENGEIIAKNIYAKALDEMFK